jgi:uncharacterized iron-regulated membrane protein
VLVRYIVLAVGSSHIEAFSFHFFCYLVCGFGLLVMFKIVLGVSLLFYCGFHKNMDMRRVHATPEDTPEQRKQMLNRRKSINRLANIERYSLVKGRIQG